MFIVTNRQVDDAATDVESAFEPVPNHKGPNELRLAEAVRAGRQWKIRILPDQITPEMAREAGLDSDIDPQTGAPYFVDHYVARRLLRRINPAAMGPGRAPTRNAARGRNLVFFVHGFNNDVAAVLDRAEKFEKQFGVEVLAFTWPADGGGIKGVASYRSDKRDALASTGALDRCLAFIHKHLELINQDNLRRIEAEATSRFARDSEQWDRFFSAATHRICPFSLTMVLHSMGNYLYKNLLKSSNYRGNLLIFDNVLLVAADTNNQDHVGWAEAIPSRSRTFVTINENDSALRASRLKMGEQQKARLGHYPYELLSRKLIYVDFTDAPYVGDSHAYFEGQALRNAHVRAFFQGALNGDRAEVDLHYDPSRNVYRPG
jgi:hypothetical protein